MSIHRKTIAATAAELEAALKDATENLAYWKRQAVIRENPTAKAEAAGLAGAWEYTVKARRAALREHPAKSK